MNIEGNERADKAAKLAGTLNLPMYYNIVPHCDYFQYIEWSTRNYWQTEWYVIGENKPRTIKKKRRSLGDLPLTKNAKAR